MSRPPRRPPTILLAVLLAVATLAALGGSCGNGFVDYDDEDYVLANPHVLGGLNASNARWALTTFDAGNWHPVTWLSLQLDATLYGTSAWGDHATSLFFHLAAGLLIYSLLCRLTAAPSCAAFAAGLFLLHPLHVESVAWVAERKDVLSGFFFALTLWAYARYATAPSLGRYGAVALCFALGLTAKPMLVTLPVVLLLLDYWPLGRVPKDPGKKNLARFALEKLPLLALSLASAAVTVVAQSQGGAVVSTDRLPLDLRIGNALVACVAYLGKALVPVGLAAFYPYPRASGVWPQALLAAVILTAITVSAVKLKQSAPFVLVGWLWYLVMLMPVIGIVQVGQQSMADRYTYLPLLGVFVAVSWGVGSLVANRPSLWPVAAALGMAALALAAAGAKIQVTVWSDAETLWSHALAVTTDNHVAHNNLGRALTRNGQLAAAVGHFREAVRVKHDYPEAHSNLGQALARQGDLAGAVTELTLALRQKPDFSGAHVNMGNVQLLAGRPAEAVAEFRAALATEHPPAAAFAGLGAALTRIGDLSEGERQLERAMAIDPRNADVHNNLGINLKQQGRLAEARRRYTDAIEADPAHAEARQNLGALLIEQGHLADAETQFAELARRHPDAETFQALGIVLGMEGKRSEAAEAFARAAALRPGPARQPNGASP